MGKKYFEINTAEGRVDAVDYTQTEYEATQKYQKPATDYQELTGAGTISHDYAVTRLQSASGGPFAVVLPPGTDENETKEIYFRGSGGSFVVSGTFWDWSTLTFNTIGRSAVLKWVDGKWMLIGGNCTAA